MSKNRVLVGGDTQNSNFYDSSRDPQRRHHALEGPYLVYFKVAPRQTISAAILPKVRTPQLRLWSCITSNSSIRIRVGRDSV